MLTEGQANRVWQKMIEAEVRSLYFGDLAARYIKRKQIITGLTFFLSSGAAATVAAQTARAVPLVLSAIAAALSAYSIAVSLDRKAATMAKLHSAWSQLHTDYDRLWYHWADDDAEIQYEDLLRRARDVSETGSTDAPYDERLIEKWQNRVNERYDVRPA
jgi:hypothetical protein